MNPGLPKTDMDITLTGSTFDVDGCHILCDYQREENNAHFAYRGNSLRFGISGGKIYVQYRLQDGGSFKQYSQTNIYTVPHDDIYRTYEFKYKPTTGRAEVLVNGVSQWSNTGSETPGINMYWSGAGNMIIGDNMNANGNNKTTLDNWQFFELQGTPLPIELTNFTADLNYENAVDLTWETASELNNDYFTIERSRDGENFEPVTEVSGNGTTSQASQYQTIDNRPLNGTVYYRLKQTDFDGTYTYSDLVTVTTAGETNATVTVYPNPANESVTVQLNEFDAEQDVSIRVIDLTGKTMLLDQVQPNINGELQAQLNIADHLTPGMYIVSVESQTNRKTQTLVVQ